MKTLRTILWLTIGALITTSVEAQTSRTITFSEAIYLAETQAVAVQRAVYEVEARDAAVAQQLAARWPSFSMAMFGQQRYGLAFDQTVGQLTQSTTEFGAAEITTSWTIFDGFASRSAIASARSARASAEYDHIRIRHSVIYEAIWLFYEVATAAAERDIAAANLTAQREQHAMVEAQISAGARPPAELFFQEERIAEAELAQLQRERQYRVALMRLVRHLALDPDTEYVFAAPDTSHILPLPYSTETLVADALERRPDLQAQEASIEAAAADLRAIRGGIWPSLAIIGSYGTTYSSTSPREFGTQLDNNRAGAIGLRLSVPLLGFQQTSARVRAGDARLRQMQVEAEDRRREVSAEVREAVLDLDIRQQEVHVAERRMRAAEAALEAEMERYRLGLTTLVTLAEVRARFIDAEVSLVRSRYSLAVARELLDYRIGMSSR